ncbi:MAG TPA: HAD hydrolase-like protein [Thermoanaerobaculaceae bacterium]|nr:HAD hydrolase-like protein [Thermoanaerobaculaceae bacterium]HPS76680.1 HAD hydrolase-like protein [Thermoanaerobaculaceae bacterium]
MLALVLDFDGVIFDSAREALLVSLRTYLALEPASTLAAEAPSLEAALCDLGTDILSVPRLAAFMALMPLGNRAEDYGVTWAILDQGRAVHDQADYDAFQAGTRPDWRQSFHRHLYAVRHGLAATRPDEWLRLHRPYPHLVEMLRRRAGQVPFAIATAKDRQSVRMLLAAHGLEGLFPGELILDKEAGVGKRAHLERLREKLAVAYSEMTFVDDKLNHLEAVGGLGVRGVLAAWGYNGVRERELARVRGFSVASEDDAEAVLFD